MQGANLWLPGSQHGCTSGADSPDSTIRINAHQGTQGSPQTGHNIPFGFTSIKASQGLTSWSTHRTPRDQRCIFQCWHKLFPPAVHFSTPSQQKGPILHRLWVQALWGPSARDMYLKSFGQWQSMNTELRLIWVGSYLGGWPKALSPALCRFLSVTYSQSLGSPAPSTPSSLYTGHRVALTPFPKSQCAQPHSPQVALTLLLPHGSSLERSALLSTWRRSVAGQEERGCGLLKPPSRGLAPQLLPFLAVGIWGSPPLTTLCFCFSSSARGGGADNPTPPRLRMLWDWCAQQLADGRQGRGCPLWDHVIYCPNQDALRVEEGPANNYIRAIGEKEGCPGRSRTCRVEPLPAHTSGGMGWSVCVTPMARRSGYLGALRSQHGLGLGRHIEKDTAGSKSLGGGGAFPEAREVDLLRALPRLDRGKET